MTVKNPFWEELQPHIEKGLVRKAFHPRDYTIRRTRGYLTTAAQEIIEEDRLREEMIRKYSWSIPAPEILEGIARFCDGRIVEMGAGRGYWAHLLSAMGMDIVAFDEWEWQPHAPWFQVEPGTPTVLKGSFHDRTLLLCWPPYREPMAYQALSNYEGEKLIYVGDTDCTGDDAFHDLLEAEWDGGAHLDNYTWPFIKDRVFLYIRKKEICS